MRAIAAVVAVAALVLVVERTTSREWVAAAWGWAAFAAVALAVTVLTMFGSRLHDRIVRATHRISELDREADANGDEVAAAAP